MKSVDAAPTNWPDESLAKAVQYTDAYMLMLVVDKDDDDDEEEEDEEEEEEEDEEPAYDLHE